jgi:CHAD domain-containing protein
MVQHLADELDLNEQQFGETQAVLDECIMKEADMMNRIQMLRTEGRKRISELLNSEQRKKFKALLHQVSQPAAAP